MVPPAPPRRDDGGSRLVRTKIESWLLAAWQRDSRWLLVLRPLAALYGLLAARRRAARNTSPCTVPLIVVGNLTVGGSGKTPLLIALAEQLAAAGWRPGVVSRGYGGRASRYPLSVTEATAAAECGDEPRLIADRTGVAVVVAPNRPAAVAALLRGGAVDIVLSDDGLQHYPMARSLELVVVDGQRQFGNARLLPAGPLREPLARLAEVDLVVVNGSQVCPQAPQAAAMTLHPGALRPLNSAARNRPLAAGAAIHAVAAIGNPQRFADSLTECGFQVSLHTAADHSVLSLGQLRFNDRLPVVVTEKDAVKLSEQTIAALIAPLWVLPVSAQLPEPFWQQLAALLGEPPHPRPRSPQ